MFHKIIKIEPLENYSLLATFESGERKLYDLVPISQRFSAFGALKSVNGLYKQVKIEPAGYAISWNNELDISADEIYFAGKSV